MGSSEETVVTSDNKNDNEIVQNDAGDISENDVADTTGTDLSINISAASNASASDGNTSKEGENSGAGNSKKTKKKCRHGKKGNLSNKDNQEWSAVRRLHYPGSKYKQNKKRAQSFPTISKYFLPTKRPRKETFIPPTKFLLGGNISDPLNLNSLQDENVNRAMNAVTPESSPLPTPPRHKAKIDVIIPPNIRDPLNLLEPLDNEEYEKRLEMQQRRPRKKPRIRRRTTETNANIHTNVPTAEAKPEAEQGMKEPLPPEPSTSKCRKRSCSDSDNSSLKGKDGKKLRRMDSLDKIVSPVVPQPGAWMRARPQQRPAPQERPASPHRTKLKSTSEEQQQMPTFHPKNLRYQYGNYDR